MIFKATVICYRLHLALLNGGHLALLNGGEVMRLTVGALCCCVALLSGAAWAATLQPGQGNLSINQGSGFQPVNARVDAKVGDSVEVTSGGSATLIYEDGCQVQVQPGAVISVMPLSPCASGSFAQDNTNNNAGMAIGAVVVMGGIAAGLIYEGTKSTNNTSGSPASP